LVRIHEKKPEAYRGAALALTGHDIEQGESFVCHPAYGLVDYGGVRVIFAHMYVNDPLLFHRLRPPA
jgi:hypothetical protein